MDHIKTAMPGQTNTMLCGFFPLIYFVCICTYVNTLVWLLVCKEREKLNYSSNEQMKHQISPPEGLIFCTSTL